MCQIGLVIGVRGPISAESTNFTFIAENPHNSLLFSMPINEFEFGPAIVTFKNLRKTTENFE